MREFSYDEITTATGTFSLDSLIGKGSHGSVYKGILRGPDRHVHKQLVAVKKPSGLKLDNEIDILSTVQSPNLVNLVGVCYGPAHKLLITEFMPNGSLHHFLHSSSSPPGWPRRMLMALQVASAILTLHNSNPAIVHRDVKSENVLLDCRWNARLADFSLAVREHSFMAVPAAGTLGYLDPGYTAADKLSLKTDVFSFGVLLLEMISSRKVMDMEKEPASIVSWAVPMIRAGRVAEVCDGRVVLSGPMERLVGRVLGVATRCVSRREERRPTMVEVVGELRGVVERGSWPSWGCLRGKISRCARAWRRCKMKRVTGTTTTKITCKAHLILNDDEDGDEM